MIKRIFILCLSILVIGYLVVAITTMNRKPDNEVCKGMELTVKDSVDYGYITPNGIKNILKNSKLYPEGKRLGDINVRALEKALDNHPFISEAECYLTSGGKVHVEVYQRIPLLRIMSSNDDDYYIDHKGKIMPVQGTSVHVAVATGFIDRKFARKELYELALYLQTDPFWKSQIEQINVTSKKELELVPRVGDHLIFLGKGENYQEKFRRLKIFYNEALNRVGWNKYERISIEFNNQIICTKKEK